MLCDSYRQPHLMRKLMLYLRLSMNMQAHAGSFTYLFGCRLLSEYLGVETMLAIVCKTYEGVKALEMYDKEGCINKSYGLHGLGASIGRALDGRFLVICLEYLRHDFQESCVYTFNLLFWIIFF